MLVFETHRLACLSGHFFFFFYNKGGTKKKKKSMWSCDVEFDLPIVDLALGAQMTIKVMQQMGAFLQILWINLVGPSGKELTESVCKGGTPLN